MAGGSFPFSSSVSRYTPTAQARLVLNVGLVPEVTASSCSLKCLSKEEAKAGLGMDGLALKDGSTSSGGGGGGGSRCEASSWGSFSELDSSQVLRYCFYPSSSTVTGDQLVLNLPKSSVSGTFMMDALNATCNSNCASPCISWNGQNSHSLSAYMDASCTTANNLNLLPNESLRDPNGQRASYGTHVRTANPHSQPKSHEFKPDDASSHNNNNNNNNNIMLYERSGVLEAAFATENDRDLEVEEQAGLSESINDSLLQGERAGGEKKAARGEQRMNSVVKGSKRKAAEALKNPCGAEVQSEKRTVRSQNESRIVRVSRLTGGKDRHSKVRTAKGLRDRRVRLSVSTAIQFYDLQDRLGFEQPSMAVEWLINNAKPAIDNLPPIADASNTTQIDMTYSNCSPVKSGVESPKDGATATAHEVGIKNGRKIGSSAVHEILPIRSSKDSYVGRSSSSTSDGSIMGTEYSSKCSLSKSARLKVARERAKKKARNSAVSFPSNTNMLQSNVTSHLMSFTGHGSVPQESCWGRNGIQSGTSTIQPLWDYSMHENEYSHQFESFSSNLTASLQQQQSSPEMQSLLRTSSHQNLDMANFTTAFMDPKQRNVAGNAAQIYLNSLMDHQPQAMQKHLGSTFVPTISSDVNFTTSDHSSRGPLQSNSSCITTANSALQKNTFADASAKVNMLPPLCYDPCIQEKFQTYSLDGNAKYQVNN